MRVISFVGRSGVGKTTLIEHLIAELGSRGYKVATVKHVVDDMDMDKPGKDSWRLARAGSDVVVVGSEDRLFLVKKIDHEPNFAEILPFILGVDLVLVEGFRKWKIPKIEVHPQGEDLLCPLEELSAIVSDEPLEVSIPCFSPPETNIIADFILQSLVAEDLEVCLLVNDEPIPLNPFVQEIISKVTLAMVSTLKLEGTKEIEILNILVKKSR
jgi:molybdopterin-guanine dinucleotide biosynthesis protein B